MERGTGYPYTTVPPQQGARVMCRCFGSHTTVQSTMLLLQITSAANPAKLRRNSGRDATDQGSDRRPSPGTPSARLLHSPFVLCTLQSFVSYSSSHLASSFSRPHSTAAAPRHDQLDDHDHDPSISPDARRLGDVDDLDPLTPQRLPAFPCLHLPSPTAFPQHTPTEASTLAPVGLWSASAQQPSRN